MDFDKYEQFGDYHWQEYAKNTPYRDHANKVRSWVRPGSTLDVGAGDGLITHLLGAEGFDNNLTAVKLARQKGKNVWYADIYQRQDLKTYHNIFMGDVIEHLEYPDDALFEVKRMMNEYSYLYIVTPPAADELHDKYHYREYTPVQLIDYMSSQGFEIIGDVEIIEKNVRMYAIFRLR